jgi:hypothetical protein
MKSIPEMSTHPFETIDAIGAIEAPPQGCNIEYNKQRQ